jgi:nitroreductase
VKVSEAVSKRRSVRDFLSTPVANQLLEELLEKSARSATGGNIQPWRVYVLNGQSMADFREYHAKRLVSHPEEKLDYQIYPSPLSEPYRTSRYELGEQMYKLLDIPREDKAGRYKQFAKNLDFFGAPSAIFLFVDRQMGSPQWADLGMFLQTFMLLAEEAGLNTCAQEAWSVRQESVSQFVNAPEELMLFCGMAIGHANPDAPVNKLRSERLPLEQFATFV